MTNRSYSAPIADAIRAHMDEHDLHYYFDEDRGVFTLLMSAGSKAKTLIYHIIVDNHNFIVNARYPLGPDPKDDACMTTMARFLTRASHGMRNGNFELDMEDGDISFKSFCCCRGLIVPSDEMIAECIQCPAAMFDKYEAGILGILFNGMGDKEAEEHCENSTGSIIAKLEELKARMESLGKKEPKEEQEETPDSDEVSFSFEEFLRMLAERDSSEEDDEDEDDDIIDAD